MKVIASSIRKGNIIEREDGQLYVVLSAESFHPGKGTPTTQIDMRRLSDGVKTTDRYKTTEQVVTVTITPVNDAPTAPATNSVATAEDTASSAVAIGAQDIDSPSLTYAVKDTAQPTKGTVTFANGSFVYTPSANANGTDTFTP